MHDKPRREPGFARDRSTLGNEDYLLLRLPMVLSCLRALAGSLRGRAEGCLGLRISVGNMKLPDYQSREPGTSRLERAETSNQ